MQGATLWINMFCWLGFVSWLGFSDDRATITIRHTFLIETKNVQNLTTFVMGIFIALILGRWWDIRELLQKVRSGSIDLAIMVTAHLRSSAEAGDENENDTTQQQQMRQRIVRLCNLAHALVPMQATDKFDSATLIEHELATQDECNILESQKNRFVTVYTWIASLLCYCADHNMITNSHAVLPRMQKNITKMRGSAGNIFMYLNCQLPYPYIQLLSFLVHFFLFVAACSSGNRIAVGKTSLVKNTAYVLMYTAYSDTIVFAYLLMIIWVIAFDGLLWLNVLLSNPFGEGAADFPVEDFCAELKSVTNAILQQHARSPQLQQ
jgi:hypothetical protein